MIIDAHVHLARELTGFRKPLRWGKVAEGDVVTQWLPPSFDPPASPPEMLLGYMDGAGVDHAIIVQHHLYGDQNETTLRPSGNDPTASTPTPISAASTGRTTPTGWHG